jgi:hypothetical protein
MFMHMNRSLISISSLMIALVVGVPSTHAQEKKLMPHHATGTFEVKMTPIQGAANDGLQRMSIDKVIHGGLEATTKGEMISAGDYKSGNAGYVAMETVTGTLDGKHGTFAFQHVATMNGGAPEMKVIVTPGSGTGELAGIAGTYTILIENGKHSYTFDYTLPSDK